MSVHQAYGDDRPAEGIFRVSNALYVDSILFEEKLHRIFGRTWIFLALEAKSPRA
jgi:hypothetical protein